MTLLDTTEIVSKSACFVKKYFAKLRSFQGELYSQIRGWGHILLHNVTWKNQTGEKQKITFGKQEKTLRARVGHAIIKE